MFLEPHGTLETDRDLLGELSKANGFTEAELAENRRGRIASSRFGRLWGQALDPLRSALMGLLGWLVFLFVLKTFVPYRLFAIVEFALGMSLWVLFAIISAGVLISFPIQLLRFFGRVANVVLDILDGKAVCIGRARKRKFVH